MPQGRAARTLVRELLGMTRQAVNRAFEGSLMKPAKLRGLRQSPRDAPWPRTRHASTMPNANLSSYPREAEFPNVLAHRSSATRYVATSPLGVCPWSMRFGQELPNDSPNAARDALAGKDWRPRRTVTNCAKTDLRRRALVNRRRARKCRRH